MSPRDAKRLAEQLITQPIEWHHLGDSSTAIEHIGFLEEGALASAGRGVDTRYGSVMVAWKGSQEVWRYSGVTYPTFVAIRSAESAGRAAHVLLRHREASKLGELTGESPRAGGDAQ